MTDTTKTNIQVLSYGGGRQTVAMCILIAQGKIDRPDRIVIADTGREKASTFDYLDEVITPYLDRVGLHVEVAPRSLAYVDLYGHNGDLLLPVYTRTGKLKTFCSDEWKASVMTRYLKLGALGYPAEAINTMPHATVKQEMKRRTATTFINWIGFALDERGRVKSADGRRFPLLEMGLTKRDCIQVIHDANLPLPPPSSCWMCPNMPNEEWRYIRDVYPLDFEQACVLDEELRANDERGGVWLHHSREPLRFAALDIEDRKAPDRQCGLGMCFL